MMEYKAMYLELFNSITDIIEQLKQAQIRTEEMYINGADDTTPETVENKKPHVEMIERSVML